MVDWQYSESIESREIVDIRSKYTNFIDGKFVEPNSKKYMKTISPSTEEVLSQIAISNKADVNKAVKAAQSGYEIWSKLSPCELSPVRSCY